MSERCKGCAFTKGTEANSEPHNHIKGLICVLTPHTFYCHESLDWKNPDLAARMSKDELRRLSPKICQGWREEVRVLAKTGYYRENSAITKLYGEMTLETLETILNETNTEKKKVLWSEFRDLLNALGKKWKKFRDKKGELRDAELQK